MTVLKVYVAEDGTKFSDELECIHYEDELRANQFRTTALLFDEDGKPLPLSVGGFESAYYIRAVTDEAAAYMAEEFKDYDNPWYREGHTNAGAWVFFNDNWTAADTIFKIAEILGKI